jgi:hypothetical protein
VNAGGVDLDRVDLAGIVLPDARSGELLDLGAGPALAVLVAIRHRY